MFLIHFELRSAWKILESRAKNPQASFPRKIIGDLGRVYYSPVFYQLLFIENPNLMGFVYFLPKFLILELSINAITEDTFEWAYKNNKVTRTLYCLLFNYLMCLDYIEALDSIDTFRDHPVGPVFITLLYTDLSQASCINQVNIIEDFILTKFAKIKDEVNFQGFLTDMIVFFYLNITTVIFFMVKISLKEISMEEAEELGDDKQSYYHDHLPSSFNGYDLDFIAKAVYMMIFFLPV